MQQIKGPAGVSSLRVQRSFGTYDHGGGNAEALANALGVALQVGPSIVDKEAAHARVAGVDARIAGVERENANDANNNLFSPLFRNQAEDGFDHQDATLDSATIAMEELVSLGELRNSTNPEDYQRWIDNRDAQMLEATQGRSDVYMRTLTAKMQGTRDAGARQFASWITSNREKQAQAAARASAKVSTMNAANAVLDILDDGGDLNTALKDLIQSGPEAFGLTHTEMRELVTEEVMNEADMLNRPDLLEGLDRRMFTTEGREDVQSKIDELFNENRTRINADRADATYLENQLNTAELLKANGLVGNAINGILDGTSDGSTDLATLRDTAYFRKNPEQYVNIAQTLANATDLTANPNAPFLEEIALGEAETGVMALAIRGGDVGNFLLEQLNEGDITSAAGLKRLAALQQQANVMSDNFTSEGLEEYTKAINLAFTDTWSDADARSISLGIDPEGTKWKPGVAADVNSQFERILAEHAIDWFWFNPEATRMDRATKREMAAKSRDEAIEWGNNTFGDANIPTQTNTPSSTEADLSILNGN